MRYFSNILLLLIGFLTSLSVSAADVNVNDFIIKRGNGSGFQTVVSGDSIEPFYYEYDPGVCIDHVLVPDAIFTVNHDKKNRKLYLTGVAGGPSRSYDIRIFGLLTNDSLNVKNYRISRPGKLTVIRPYLETKQTVFDVDTETIPDTIRIDYTKFTYSVWTSDLPAGMKLEKGNDHCSIVATDYLPSGEYSFKVYGADSLYYEKDSIIVTDGGTMAIDTMKFHPRLYCDSIEFKINVYEGGLMKIGEGGTKQVVELGDSIVPFGFEWKAAGKLTHEAVIEGLTMTVDSAKHQIMINGTPKKLGVQDFDIAYQTGKDRPYFYTIEVAVLKELKPIIEEEDVCDLEQIVDFGSSIRNIYLDFYNADSIVVEGLPEGIEKSINYEDGEMSIFGVLKESGKFEIKVKAIGRKSTTVKVITLYSSDYAKSDGFSGVRDVLSDDANTEPAYDMLGRRVSEDKMDNRNVLIINKKIVIRK